MFKYEQCPSTFTRKENLVVHQKMHDVHDSVRFPCPECTKSFGKKSNLNRHIKNVHGKINIFNLIIIVFINLIFIL
jgi:uncharacterized Zn-finger protein